MHYPYYSPTFISGSVLISPFGYYFGVCPPFLERGHSIFVVPSVFYVDVPVYSGDACRGYPPISSSDNYADRDSLLDREPGLTNAVDELTEAFRNGNIDSLVTLVDPQRKIAVFLKGKYKYSLDSDDYLDLTRDAFQSMSTISFNITRIHSRAPDVYVVSGEHVYRSSDGSSRKVYVSYVLEDINEVWTLTQVGTAPDRVQSWKSPS